MGNSVLPNLLCAIAMTPLVIFLLLMCGLVVKALNPEACHDASKDVCACGQSQCETNEIHNGVTAKPHQYPWIVKLLGDYLGPCAGTLVSPRVILSANHCIRPTKKDIGVAVLGRHEIDLDVQVFFPDPEKLRKYKTIPV